MNCRSLTLIYSKKLYNRDLGIDWSINTRSLAELLVGRLGKRLVGAYMGIEHNVPYVSILEVLTLSYSLIVH